MDKTLDLMVRQRAQGLCEYCHAPQAFYAERFQIDHVIARQHGGATLADNLALCCLECNRRKGPNISSIDPQSGGHVALFHPRQHSWSQHFACNGALIVGRTPAGRATVALLEMNRPPRVAVRQAMIEEGIFPTPGPT